MTKPKKYCLLENGQIESCYYLDGQGKATAEARPIVKEKGAFYILVGKFAHGTYIECWRKIKRFGDTEEELKDDSLTI